MKEKEVPVLSSGEGTRTIFRWWKMSITKTVKTIGK